jgi:hypothetical protein
MDCIANKKGGIMTNVEVHPQNNQTQIRTFNTGANRNSDEGKLDYEGFLSPFVLKRFGLYMQKHRALADGTLRESDNWQKGLPYDVCLKSLLRHVMDVWIDNRGGFANETIEDALCAIIFNAQSMLLTLLKEE